MFLLCFFSSSGVGLSALVFGLVILLWYLVVWLVFGLVFLLWWLPWFSCFGVGFFCFGVWFLPLWCLVSSLVSPALVSPCFWLLVFGALVLGFSALVFGFSRVGFSDGAQLRSPTSLILS